MSDQERLNFRIRVIQFIGLGILAVTVVVWLAIPGWKHVTSGLCLGELGGAYVVYSMIRQGHRNDDVQGAALFMSGILGMITRFVVLALVVIAALKWHVSPVSALVGYLSGFVLVFAGLAGYMR